MRVVTVQSHNSALGEAKDFREIRDDLEGLCIVQEDTTTVGSHPAVPSVGGDAVPLLAIGKLQRRSPFITHSLKQNFEDQ